MYFNGFHGIYSIDFGEAAIFKLASGRKNLSKQTAKMTFNLEAFEIDPDAARQYIDVRWVNFQSAATA